MAVPVVAPSTGICIVQSAYPGLLLLFLRYCFAMSDLTPPSLCTSGLETPQVFIIFSYINHNQFWSIVAIKS